MIPKHFHGHLDLHKRIRRLKRILRPLPRKTNVHRYPIIKYFAATARNRSYLWSFKRHYVVRAIYLGSILSLLPLYGLQIALAFALSLASRSNLMVMCALQFITNPLTAVPLYLLCYKVGDLFLDPFLEPVTKLSPAQIESQSHAGLFDMLRNTFATMRDSTPGEMAHAFRYLLLCLTTGGLILGYFVGFTLSFTYQYIAEQMAQKFPQTFSGKPMEAPTDSHSPSTQNPSTPDSIKPESTENNK